MYFVISTRSAFTNCSRFSSHGSMPHSSFSDSVTIVTALSDSTVRAALSTANFT